MRAVYDIRSDERTAPPGPDRRLPPDDTGAEASDGRRSIRSGYPAACGGTAHGASGLAGATPRFRSAQIVALCRDLAPSRRFSNPSNNSAFRTASPDRSQRASMANHVLRRTWLSCRSSALRTSRGGEPCFRIRTITCRQRKHLAFGPHESGDQLRTSWLPMERWV